jgi:hypothetical protein
MIDVFLSAVMACVGSDYRLQITIFGFVLSGPRAYEVT